MVMSASPTDGHFPGTGRYLQQSKIQAALGHAQDLGASYAEVRLMAITDSTVALRDGKLERAIPGQEIGVTMRILADGAWGVHSTTDVTSLPGQVESTVRLAKAVAARRASKDRPVALAEVPIIESEEHWKPKKDVRNTDLDTKLHHLNTLYDIASEDDRIVSVTCGWHDEHLHTELITSEGMNRTWSFQRSLINATVTGRDGGDVVSYRTRHGGEGGLSLIHI